MLRKIISSLLALAMLCMYSPIINAQETASGATIYVAPDGNDNNPGTLELPLRTFDGARQKVRDSKDSENPITEVVFRGGDYHMAPTYFDEGDSGTADAPITYRAYEGEKPNFKGSIVLDSADVRRVTDEAILSRMYDSVRNKVVYIDLSKYGITKADMFDASLINGMYNIEQHAGFNSDYNCLYINGVEGLLAQWPNGARQYTAWSRTLNTQTIYYDDTEPDRWEKANDWWIGCFPDYDFDWARIWVKKLDTLNKTIEVKDKPVATLTNPYSKRWKAFNLLEEIDIPGEFYVDQETMILYFYPTEPLENAKLEFSVTKQALINLTNTKHLVFKGLTFSQIRSDAFKTTDIDSVHILNCHFKDISNCAIRNNGTVYAQTLVNYWQKQRKNSMENCSIKGCTFNGIGGSAAFLNGAGDLDTLKPSNTVIEDNYIFSTNTRYIMNSALMLGGCAFEIRNNNISRSTQHAIHMRGCNFIVENNEIHDMMLEVGDAGAIYIGRNQVWRGTKINNNFLHDLTARDPRLSTGTVALYVDDGQSGIELKNNIVVNAYLGYNSNIGNASTVENNIFVGNKRSWYFRDGKVTEGANPDVSMMGTIDDAINDIYDKEVYFKAFPALKEWAETHKNLHNWTVTHNNLSVGSLQEPVVGVAAATYGDFGSERSASDLQGLAVTGQQGSNLLLESADVFVDPENKDYRIKKGSVINKLMPTLPDEDYDIDKIGMINDLTFNNETSPYKLVYPHDGQTVPSEKVELYWQDAFGASEYTITIAKDKEFKDVVLCEKTYANILPVAGLEKGTRYYWKVEARNNSREMAASWDGNSGVRSFVTSLYEVLDTSGFESASMQAQTKLSELSEGNEAGMYKVGTIDMLTKYIQDTGRLANTRLGRFTQTGLNQRTEVIRNYLNDSSLINKGYLDLWNFSEPKYWSSLMQVTDSEIKNANTGSESIAGTKDLSYLSGNTVFCFDFKSELNSEDSWLPFGFNMDVTTQYIGKNRGYYLVLKRGLIELQQTNGSSNKVVATKEINVCDGNVHSMQIGVLNTSVGNYFILNVDGENIFRYADASTLTVQVPMEFVTSVTAKGEYVTLTKTTAPIPGSDEFDKLMKEAEYLSVPAVISEFPGVSGLRMFKLGSPVMISQEGIYTTAHAIPETNGGFAYLPADVAIKLMGAEGRADANTCQITWNGKTVEFTKDMATYTVNGESHNIVAPAYTKNGVLMISAEDLVKSLGIQYSVDVLNGIVSITEEGVVYDANDGAYLAKANLIINKLAGMLINEDVILKDIK